MADTDVKVPNVVGLTEAAADAALAGAGLQVGPVTKAASSAIPPGGVISQNPAASTVVSPGTPVTLEISASKIELTNLLFIALGIGILGVIVWGLQGKSGFLETLADKENARGLITFLIAITTVGIAVILSISTIVLRGGDEDKDRFDRGKQVLTMLIGVLGTIVGFYFGAAVESPTSAALSSLACNQSSLASGSSSPCSVTLAINAPIGGTLVTLSSSGTAIIVPSSVTVAAGANTATFTVQAGIVAAPTTTTVTASMNGGSRSVIMTVTPVAVPPPPK